MVRTVRTVTPRTWCVPFARSRRGHGAYRSHGHAADMVRAVRTVTPRTWCVPFARSRRGHGACRSHGHAADMVRTVRTVAADMGPPSRCRHAIHWSRRALRNLAVRCHRLHRRGEPDGTTTVR